MNRSHREGLALHGDFRPGHSICGSLELLPLSLVFGVVALLPRVAGSRSDRSGLFWLMASSTGRVAAVARLLQLRAVTTRHGSVRAFLRRAQCTPLSHAHTSFYLLSLYLGWLLLHSLEEQALGLPQG